jgi:hypothetical protein
MQATSAFQQARASQMLVNDPGNARREQAA